MSYKKRNCGMKSQGLSRFMPIACLVVFLCGICLGIWLPDSQENAEEVMPRVSRLTYSEIEAMGPEKLAAYYSAMQSLSENEVLTAEEMNAIAENFHNIWNYFPNLDKEEFSDQCYGIFSDIYEQVYEQDIPMEELTSWASFPDLDVICKYIYGNAYIHPENVACPGLYLLDLSSEDAERLARIFFENSEMETNTAIPRDFILHGYSDDITRKAWEHMEKLSLNTAPETSLTSDVFTAYMCSNLMACVSDNPSLVWILEIEKNILDNPYYDISVKYECFCNASQYRNSYIYNTISETAIDSLLRFAKTADEETADTLRELANVLDAEAADVLIRILNGDLIETEATQMQTVATEAPAVTEETTVPTEAIEEESKAPSEAQEWTEPPAAEHVYPDVNDSYLVVLKQYWQAATMPEEGFSELYWNQADLESVLSMQEREPGTISDEEVQHYYDLPRVETVVPYVNRYRLDWDCGYSPDEPIPYLYTCYDIDGNGVDELLIGQGDETDAAIIGVFSLQDDALDMWVNDIVYRANMTVYLEGTMCVDGSSSASLHSYHFYRVAEDGSGLEQIREFCVDYENPNVQTVLDAVAEYVAELTKVETWNWKRIVACS